MKYYHNYLCSLNFKVVSPMKRRTFIRNISLASLSVPFFVKNLSAQATPFGNFDIPISYEDRILVLIRMNGGNDGLRSNPFAF